jgi:methionyl-tRNA synthetase
LHHSDRDRGGDDSDGDDCDSDDCGSETRPLDAKAAASSTASRTLLRAETSLALRRRS